jgi:hypothetical protein
VHLLADLVDRGLDVDQGVLVVLDGSRGAVAEMFGPVPVQRCIRHDADPRIMPFLGSWGLGVERRPP